MTIDLNKVCEGIDYRIEAIDPSSNTDYPAWFVESLTEYPNTMFIFDNVEIDGKQQTVSFRYQAVDMTTKQCVETEQMNDYAADVLTDIIRNQFITGGVELHDKDSSNS